MLDRADIESTRLEGLQTAPFPSAKRSYKILAHDASPLGKEGLLDPLTSYPSRSLSLLTVQKSGCCVIPCGCSRDRWCPNLSVCGDLVDPKNMHLSGWTAIRRIHHHHFICSNNVKTNTLETVQWYSL